MCGESESGGGMCGLSECMGVMILTMMMSNARACVVVYAHVQRLCVEYKGTRRRRNHGS